MSLSCSSLFCDDGARSEQPTASLALCCSTADALFCPSRDPQLYLAHALALSVPANFETGRINEVWDRATTEKAGIVWRGNHTLSPLPHEYLKTEDLPDSFSWGDKNLLTMSRNQHIPQ